jgi:hypothetical protein
LNVRCPSLPCCFKSKVPALPTGFLHFYFVNYRLYPVFYITLYPIIINV